MNETNQPIDIKLTDEQMAALKPIFDLVDQQKGKGGTCSVVGQAFSYSDIVQFRFLTHLQTVIIKSAILAALDVENREGLEIKRKQLNAEISRLEADKAKVDEQIAKIETKEQSI